MYIGRLNDHTPQPTMQLLGEGGRELLPLPQPFFRHTGYITAWETGGIETRDEIGVPTTVYRFEWVNPHPGKTVIEVDRSVAEDIIVCRILAVSKS